MTANNDLIDVVHRNVTEIITGSGLFPQVAVRQMIDGKIADMVTKALKGLIAAPNGKRGLTLIVHVPDVETSDSTGGGFPRPWCEIRLELINNQTINDNAATGANRTPSSVATALFELLNNAFLTRPRVQLMPAPAPVRGVIDGEDLTRFVTFRFALPLAYQARVATPRLVANQTGNTIDLTMSCSTAGAAIYYTTTDDATEPAYPSQTTGTLYTAPLTLTNEHTLRAVAFKTGSLPSHEARLEPSEGVAYTPLGGNDDTPLAGNDDTPLAGNVDP